MSDAAFCSKKSGTLTSSDVDDGATATWSGDATAGYGSFAIIFFFNDTATTEIYTLSLHDALPICDTQTFTATVTDDFGATATETVTITITGTNDSPVITTAVGQDRKSTRLNSSH